jgi:sugar lactone lactonase YvrE
VAGSSTGAEGPDATLLNFPNDVIVDDETNTVYVIDTSNNRVQRWNRHASDGETLVGARGMSNDDKQYLLCRVLTRLTSTCWYE